MKGVLRAVGLFYGRTATTATIEKTSSAVIHSAWCDEVESFFDLDLSTLDSPLAPTEMKALFAIRTIEKYLYIKRPIPECVLKWNF